MVRDISVMVSKPVLTLKNIQDLTTIKRNVVTYFRFKKLF